MTRWRRNKGRSAKKMALKYPDRVTTTSPLSRNTPRAQVDKLDDIITLDGQMDFDHGKADSKTVFVHKDAVAVVHIIGVISVPNLDS